MLSRGSILWKLLFFELFGKVISKFEKIQTSSRVVHCHNLYTYSLILLFFELLNKNSLYRESRQIFFFLIFKNNKKFNFSAKNIFEKNETLIDHCLLKVWWSTLWSLWALCGPKPGHSVKSSIEAPMTLSRLPKTFKRVIASVLLTDFT
jgi:hypothetical protein